MLRRSVSERDKTLLGSAIQGSTHSNYAALGVSRGFETLVSLGLEPHLDRRIAAVHAECSPIKVSMLLRQSLSPAPAEARVHKPIGTDDNGSRNNFAILSERFVRALITMNLAWWANPRFLPTEGNLTQLLFPDAEVSQIPYGVETLWYDFHNERYPNLNLPNCWPRWFDAAYDSLCDLRRDLFSCSVLSAIDFLWLHELGHMLNGHFTAIQPWETSGPRGALGSLSGIDSVNSQVSYSNRDLRRAFEIEADEWAMDHLIHQMDKNGRKAFENRPPNEPLESSPKPATEPQRSEVPAEGNSPSNVLQMKSSAIGVLSALISWDYYQLLAGKANASVPVSSSLYPPLWFRIDNCLSRYSSMLNGKPEFTCGRSVHSLLTQVHFAVTQLCNVHPYVAVCVGTPLDPVRNLLREKILHEANQTAEQHWLENEGTFNHRLRLSFKRFAK